MRDSLHTHLTFLFLPTLWYLSSPLLLLFFLSVLLPIAFHFSLLDLFPYSFYAYISLSLTLPPLLLPSILVSICCVWARLHGWRKGKESIGLVWIIHAAALVHQSSWDPPDACPPDFLLLSPLPLYMHSLSSLLPVWVTYVLLFNNFRALLSRIGKECQFLGNSAPFKHFGHQQCTEWICVCLKLCFLL